MRILNALLLSVCCVAALLAQQPAAKDVDVFGQRIHYVEAGSSGPTVILLHGLGGDETNWTPTIPALASTYHVFVPDQLGFGKSDKPLINYRVGTLVDFLEGFCRKVGIAKATLVGNSLGGWVSMMFAVQHPDRVEKLILVDSAGLSGKALGTPEPTRDMLLALNPSTLAGVKAVLHLIFYNDALASNDMAAQAFFAEKLKRGDGYTVNQFIDSIARGEDYVDNKLSGISAPTLIIWGRQDRLVPLAAGKELEKRISGAKLVDLDKCGHVPQLECSAAFNTTLTQFLAGSTSASK